MKFVAFVKNISKGFRDIFHAYPKVTFNLIFFALLSISMYMFYLRRGDVKSKEETVKNIIESLSATQKLDTLAQLMAGNEIKITQFPHMYTYIVKPRHSIITPEEFKPEMGNYLHTIGFSFLGLINDNCYLYKAEHGNWEIKTLADNTFIDPYTYEHNYYDDRMALPLNEEGKTNNYLLICKDSCRELHLDIPDDSLKSRVLACCMLSDKSVLLTTRIRNNDADVNNQKRKIRETKSDTKSSWVARWEAEQEAELKVNDKQACISEVFFNRKSEIINYSHIAISDTALPALLVNPRSRLVTAIKNGAHKLYINSLYGNDEPGNDNGITINLDSLCKTKSPFYFMTPVHDNGANKSSARDGYDALYSYASYYLIYAAPTYDTLFVSHCLIQPNHVGVMFRPHRQIDTLPMRIMHHKGQRFHGIRQLDHTTWIRVIDEAQDSIQYIRLQQNSAKKLTDTSFTMAFSAVGIASAANDRAIFRRKTRDIVRFSDDGIEHTTHEDSAFLKKVENADLYISEYSDNPEFVAVLPGKLAFVAITKNGKKYSYEMISNTRVVGGVKTVSSINWPENAIRVEAVLDYFYLVMLIIIAVSLYFVLYFILRRYIPQHDVVMDYSNPIFTKLPFLTMKMKSIENEVLNLKLRSDKMLILGILFGAGGVLASIITFQITNEQIPLEWNNPRTLLGILRPIIMLVFVETFTFYFLKQYRIIYNEYKRFYSVYLNLFSFLNIIELNETDMDDSTKYALRKQFANGNVNLLENSGTTAINEFERDSVLKLLDSLNKFKKGV